MNPTMIVRCMTDVHRIILAVDDFYCDLVQRPRSELIGRDCLSFTAPQDYAMNNGLLTALQGGGPAFSITKHYVRPDRSKVEVTNHVSYFKDGAGPVRLVATCQPIGIASPSPDVVERAMLAHQISLVMEANASAFDPALSGTPALQMLLMLYLAEVEGRGALASELVTRLPTPRAVGERWLRVLIRRGYVEEEAPNASATIGAVRIGADAFRTLEAMLIKVPPFRGA